MPDTVGNPTNKRGAFTPKLKYLTWHEDLLTLSQVELGLFKIRIENSKRLQYNSGLTERKQTRERPKSSISCFHFLRGSDPKIKDRYVLSLQNKNLPASVSQPYYILKQGALNTISDMDLFDGLKMYA